MTMNPTEQPADGAPNRQSISAGKVCLRLPMLATPEARSLVWFLQSLSFEPGGLGRVAREVVNMFPERLQIGTAADPKERTRLLRRIAGDNVGFIDPRLRDSSDFDLSERPWTEAVPAGPTAPTEAELCEHANRAALERLPEMLRGFVSSRSLYLPGGEQFALRAAREEMSENDLVWVTELGAPWFRDLPGALLAYQRRHAEAVLERFHATNIGRAVWRELDRGLACRGGSVILGESGLGKTEAAKAWVDAHRGEARLARVPDSRDKLAFFRAIASALGVGATYSQHTHLLRERVTDVLRKAGLLLVLDEAHFLLPEPGRGARAELVNWLRELHDAGVALCLIATPQLGRDFAELERRAGWNLLQFRRRFSRWVDLDTETRAEDLAALAARLLPGAGSKGVKLAVSYALLHRDVSGLGDLVKAARYHAGLAGRAEATAEDVRDAHADCLASDRAMDAALSGAGRAARPPRNPRPATISLTQSAEASPGIRAGAAEPLQPVRAELVEGFPTVRRGLIPAPETV